MEEQQLLQQEQQEVTAALEVGLKALRVLLLAAQVIRRLQLLLRAITAVPIVMRVK
jgi:hypothetical protein